ncbi:glycosyltransferase family 2 protein [Halpernia frigidisoli]|uniref:Glycosyltransferase, GT2 family n=1 Tax=Halpernia frigidisoli TaxID=1125876 RepID=A0A1I3E5B3_9FLAO|nr:glycosyltransferase family 2 protein [Halpernia frigidisoli]SFH93891.1 Glycosyltransferase, GT2 family [Halpernia frigidisoli]
MRLSIIIVHYNVEVLLRNCLLSLQKYLTDLSFEIIVIDNKSPDNTWKNLIAEFPKVNFIASENNDGFAVANNFAAKSANGDYLLLLNPDTEFEGFYINEILNFADSKLNFGCLGVRMHDINGIFLPESKRAVPNMINSFEKLMCNLKTNNLKSYYRNDVAEYEIAEVEVITGAFLLIKKEVYLEIGGLDEAYFMYGEDIDLCYTLLQKNYKNYYYGKYSILHLKGESSVKDLIYLKRFYGAMHIFLRKYYKAKNPFKFTILSLGLNLKHSLEKYKVNKKEIPE